MIIFNNVHSPFITHFIISVRDRFTFIRPYQSDCYDLLVSPRCTLRFSCEYYSSVFAMIVWYNSLQRMHIRWGNTFSTCFCVSNCVKQGGIVSPVLFIVYMHDLSCELNIGGCIGGEIVHHLSYLCFICLSSAGMQKLLNVYSKYFNWR